MARPTLRVRTVLGPLTWLRLHFSFSFFLLYGPDHLILMKEKEVIKVRSVNKRKERKKKSHSQVIGRQATDAQHPLRGHDSENVRTGTHAASCQRQVTSWPPHAGCQFLFSSSLLWFSALSLFNCGAENLTKRKKKRRERFTGWPILCVFVRSTRRAHAQSLTHQGIAARKRKCDHFAFSCRGILDWVSSYRLRRAAVSEQAQSVRTYKTLPPACTATARR